MLSKFIHKREVSYVPNGTLLILQHRCRCREYSMSIYRLDCKYYCGSDCIAKLVCVSSGSYVDKVGKVKYIDGSSYVFIP